MSSTEATFSNGRSTQSNPVGFDPASIDEFIKTGYKGADSLKGAQTISSMLHGNTFNDPTVRDANGNDIESVVAAYNTWKTNQDQSAAFHQHYVDVTMDQPGRQATILGDMGGPETKQILGDPTGLRGGLLSNVKKVLG